MPLNPFDFIWYANNLVPKQDDLKNNLFETMYEEYALIKSKSILSSEQKTVQNNCNNSNWSFSSSNNPLFSDDYTSQSCISKCGNNCANLKKKKDKKAKLKKNNKKKIVSGMRTSIQKSN